ncbi:MAG: pyruvate:ferredoxin (flavodoxin) oxidoreductase [Phycisphaerales bacterium]|nr:pyruvate:ferredoxin (flavodoxin) oxidoreductase [Phycisphaerales bacterium]MCB9855716.1 pyruvate:ferredoxin (flavodoxin) oxidoreductase [Phycisphaerales bacterium]MCB9862611.1 pyruvate:ferredoxin (flavodoxin) oxidoreductase [Phycisphaerales bacterium]
MNDRPTVMIDGNEAAAHVAYHINDVIAIYPITPSSPMGEWADQWASEGRRNLWGSVPSVAEMQSEGGAAGAVHGALQTGSMTTTFTASQGLLLMIPNMFKIAGELTPCVFHVAARTVATHALSIFGDHSDVMACRMTGWGMLAAGSVQETMDLALISYAASLESRIPFLHFFDGFRTSHEVMKCESLTPDDMRSMLDERHIAAHRARALSPERPAIRGTAQNPDVFFQAREACNPHYMRCPAIVQLAMDRFAKLTGRSYHLFDYFGAPDADRVVIMMGSGAEAAHEAINQLITAGEKVGLLKVRLYRPFSPDHLLAALPASVKSIAVLDRTKEPGADGEPLYKDVQAAMIEAWSEGRLPFATPPRIVGGRYGLSSKEFTPAMVKAVYDNLKSDRPKNHFTIGIRDDISHTSLEFDESFDTEPNDVVRAIFFGLGSDGTVGANKNSIKIIGDETPNYAQGYFVYDSKKAGSVTVSHLRFGPRPIRSTYQVGSANFIGCHQWTFLEKVDVLGRAVKNATLLINSPYGKDDTWNHLPRKVQEQIIAKKIKVFVIDAYEVAKAAGMGSRINTVMQTCFFAVSGVLPKDEAIAAIKNAIKKTYGAKGDEVVKKNWEAVDTTLANLFEVAIPDAPSSDIRIPLPVSGESPEFVQTVLGEMIAGRGDYLPVSALPIDGTFPTNTAQWEKRNIAHEIPVWDPKTCIQCGKCAIVCPHATIRIKAYEPSSLSSAPTTFKSTEARGKEFEGLNLTIQVAPEDCTGCGICVEICPAKNKSEARLKAINMAPQPPLREGESENYKFFLDLPEIDRDRLKINSVKGSQFLQPLFEYSGACSGCGETPYVKLMSQLFGDRSLIANATGCSSIYGGNLPTTPWATNAEGRGPAWCNSLFEDNAEFGLGFRLTADKLGEYARELVGRLAERIGRDVAEAIIHADQSAESGIRAQRARVADLVARLATINEPDAQRLISVAEALVKKSIWILGGDGWAYDIGYGGLDHVLASGRNVNVLVLDTEVYSNTGGQCSKSTPRAAVAKFAAGGKSLGKKDLAMIAMTYGHVYVATVAMGANDNQTVKAFLEAEAYDGPSLIIAYSHCIAHGINMRDGMDIQNQAVDSGHFPLFRYNPMLRTEGKSPLVLDSKPPRVSFADFAYRQNRFKMLTKSKPDDAKRLLNLASQDAKHRWERYKSLADAEAAMAATGGNGHS